MPSKVELTGGAFQDAEGNVLANGYLHFLLSVDGSVSGVGNICSGIEIVIQLDSNGNAVAGQFIWGNDVILPPNSFYKVTGFTAEGQPAWGPNNQQVMGSSPFNLGGWIPNQIISWTPSTSAITLKNNGTLNSSQNTLNLESTDDSITITDEGGGNINLQASGGTEFNTPGQGWFFGGQDYNPIGLSAGGAINLKSAVACVQLILESEWVISSAAAFCITGGGAGEFATAGIYSADGNTKLIDCGASAFDMSTHSQAVSQVTFESPITLEPGVYWFAWTSTSAGGGMLVHELNSSLSDLLNNWSFPNSSPVAPVRFGTAANAATGTTLPATLGAITPFSYGTEVPVLAVMFQV